MLFCKLLFIWYSFGEFGRLTVNNGTYGAVDLHDDGRLRISVWML